MKIKEILMKTNNETLIFEKEKILKKERKKFEGIKTGFRKFPMVLKLLLLEAITKK